MPSARLRLVDAESSSNGLPEILKTPSGTVLIEIQGVINVGDRPLIRTELDIDSEASHCEQSAEPITLGSLDLAKIDETGRPVKLLVGHNQLLSGRLQKLSLPLAVMQMPASADGSQDVAVVEIITHKLVFDKRPEPVMG